MRILITLFLLCSFLNAASSSNEEEVGSYQRKSITYLDAVWLMDGSVKGMPKHIKGKLLREIKKKISLTRFDYNAIPDAFLNEFVQEANSKGQVNIDLIEQLLERTLLKEILQAVEVEKELRAQKLLTEQEKNSFITDKAKTLGISKDELEQVMNSAYIYVPVAGNFNASLVGRQFTAHMDVGILWFKIIRTEEETKIKLVVKNMTRCQGISQAGQIYMGYGDFRDYAFGKLIEQSAKNLKVATQEFADFQLSGQVLDVEGSEVGFDLGKSEGLHVDDIYKLYETWELADGSTERKEVGWMDVSSVDLRKSDGIRSEGILRSGDADIGTEVKEFPLMKLQMQFGLQSYPLEFPNEINYNSENILGNGISSQNKQNIGPEFTVAYNLGSSMGVSKFFGEFSIGLGFGSLSYQVGKLNEDLGIVNWTMKGALTKNWVIYKRWTTGLKIGAQFQQVYFSIDNVTSAWEPQNDFGYYQIGLLGGMQSEFSISPQWKFGVKGSYSLFPSTGSWTMNDNEVFIEEGLNMSGLSVGAYFSFTPKSMAIDPLDFIRGNLR